MPFPATIKPPKNPGIYDWMKTDPRTSGNYANFLKSIGAPERSGLGLAQSNLLAKGTPQQTFAPVDYGGGDPQAGLYATSIDGRTVDPRTGKVGPIGGGIYKKPGVYDNSPGAIPVSSQPYRDPNNGLIVGSPEWVVLMQRTRPQDFQAQGPVTPLSMSAPLATAPNPLGNFPGLFNYAGLPDPFNNYKI